MKLVSLSKIGLLFVSLTAVTLTSCNNSNPPSPTTYEMAFIGENCHANNKEKYEKDDNVEFTIEPDSGYVLPNKETVMVTGISTFDYNLSSSGKATFKCIMPANAVSVTVTATPVTPTYTLTAECNNGTVSGNESPYEKGDPVSLIFTAGSNYVLPTSVDDFDELKGIDKSAVTYDNTTGSLTFSMPAKEVSVKVTATPVTPTYTLTALCNNGTVSGNESPYGEGDSVSLTFIASSNYVLPTSVDDFDELKGIDKSAVTYHSYNTTGSLTFKMPANTVSVTVTATPVTPTTTYTLTLILSGCNVYGQSTYSKPYNAGQTIDAITVSPNDDYDLNEDSIADGYEEYWEESSDGNYVLSNLVMDKSHTIVIDAESINACFTITTSNCKISEGSTQHDYEYSAYFKKGTTPSNKYTINSTTHTGYYLPETISDLPTNLTYDKTSDSVATISFNSAITEDISINIVASSQYSITIEHNNCSVGGGDTQYYDFNQSVSLEFTPEEHYALPAFVKNPEITITGIDISKISYHINEGKGYMSFSMPAGNVSITISAISNYNLNATDGNHLLFKTTSGAKLENILIPIDSTEDYEFVMSVPNTQNAVDYHVPTTLNIIIGKQKLSSKGYKIVKDPEEKSATVTIFNKFIVDDITIKGEAIEINYYNYGVICNYGLEDVSSGIHNKDDEDLSLTFAPKQGFQLPKAENIYILFDNVYPSYEIKSEWVSPAEEGVAQEYCSYDETGGVLTIKDAHIDSNIEIIVRANNYNLLEESTWSAIFTNSFFGYAPYIYYLGEEKTVKVNNINHKVRIIGFNHDDLSNGLGKAGITFEFVNLITKDDYEEATYWNDNPSPISHFEESTLNYFLNNDKDCVLNKLPNDLQRLIQSVSKKAGTPTPGGTYIATTYDTKLFPLAHDEMVNQKEEYVTENEGTIYQYYEEHQDVNDRIKHKVGGISESYWLRSPSTYTEFFGYAWYCNKDGKLSYEYIVTKKAVAPAFCI